MTFLYEKVRRFLKELAQEENSPELLDVIKLFDAVKDVNNNPKAKKWEKKEVTRLANKIFQKEKKVQFYKDTIKKLESGKNTVYSAFITLATPDVQREYLRGLKASPLRRLFLCCCKRSYDLRRFKGSTLRANESPEPINIKWKNIATPGSVKLIKRSISWLITLVLLFIRKKHRFNVLALLIIVFLSYWLN